MTPLRDKINLEVYNSAHRSVEMVESAEFPHLFKKSRVLAVPEVVIN